ncbi:MAG: hypothetical protein JSV99_04500, partial [Planctomycetota bacterium]
YNLEGITWPKAITVVHQSAAFTIFTCRISRQAVQPAKLAESGPFLVPKCAFHAAGNRVHYGASQFLHGITSMQ